MAKSRTFHRKKILFIFVCFFMMLLGLIGRLVYLMIFDAEYYQDKAQRLHEREREIKAARGKIVDKNGVVLASNKTVCTVSVIHSQIQDEERVIEVLTKELDLTEAWVRERVEKISSMEKIKTNVEKDVGDCIREYNLAGVKVDEDYKRYYPFNELASKVLGFTGGDNQGIIGLEVKYEDVLKGINGSILTLTDARGVELDAKAEGRVEPQDGNTLQISLDYNIQKYAQQMAERVMEQKSADKVSLLIMNPQDGSILAMVNVPEFNLNEPFELVSFYSSSDASEDRDSANDNGGSATAANLSMSDKEKQDALNQMWRNGCINDTYEPGSTFKIITSSACLEEGVVKLDDTFSCPGYAVVEDRRIRCHKVGGHGSETFVQGIQNSCNPVFINIGLRLGASKFYDYFEQFGLLSLTNVDLPGEAGTIMHRKQDIGLVELATMTFGQSFQLTPIQMATTVSSLINGGRRVTPHLGVQVLDTDGNVVKKLSYSEKSGVVSAKTSETMRMLLESVVAEGSGRNAQIEGYRIGGKTATSETLPRSQKKYISSFIGFAPADHPQVLAMILIHNPQGVYYGGTIAAPVVRDIFDNILPYLGVEKTGNTKSEP